MIRKPIDSPAKVVCFPGLFQKFLLVDPAVFLEEVSRVFPTAEVSAVHPDYDSWGRVPGRHAEGLAELRLNLGQEICGKSTMFVGTSFGGYVALLLGNLLEVSAVLAYTPPVSLQGLNIGNSRQREHFDLNFISVTPYLNGRTQTLVVGDASRTEPSDAHNHLQLAPLRDVSNVHVKLARRFDFAGRYFPRGKFAGDLRELGSATVQNQTSNSSRG